MPFTVIYDADVLHRAPVRDLLVRLAARPVLNLRARWTEQILDEMVASIVRRHPDKADRLRRTRELMCDAVPDCLVTGWEPLVEALDLPDPDDRHVLAAAIRSDAEVIVTYNVRHFPAASLSPFDVEAQHPDDFLAHLVNLDSAVMLHVLHEQVEALRRPPLTVDDLLTDLADTHHLIRTVSSLRRHLE